ncbi:MAG: type II toxin-antitoxin system HicB family antitoxin [Chloroflexota bacterium]
MVTMLSEARSQRTVKAVIRPGEDCGYIAECLELPVVTQGEDVDEVAHNLQEAVALCLADEDPGDFGVAADPTVLATVELIPSYAKTT